MTGIWIWARPYCYALSIETVDKKLHKGLIGAGCVTPGRARQSAK